MSIRFIFQLFFIFSMPLSVQAVQASLFRSVSICLVFFCLVFFCLVFFCSARIAKSEPPDLAIRRELYYSNPAEALFIFYSAPGYIFSISGYSCSEDIACATPLQQLLHRHLISGIDIMKPVRSAIRRNPSNIFL